MIRSVKSKAFYLALPTTTIPKDSHELHTSLHQIIKQQHDSNTSSISPGKDSKSGYLVYEIDYSMPDNNFEFEIFYSRAGQSLFKRRIMRGSNYIQASPYPNYLGPRNRNQQNYNQPRFGLTRQTLRCVRLPIKNPVDNTGSPILCRICNSWFHLQSACPYRTTMYPNLANISNK